MPKKLSRRSFLKHFGAAAAAAGVTGISRARPSLASALDEPVGIVVDLTKCDGCPDVPVPRCVSACQAENESRYPVVQEESIMDYWPQHQHEDWRPRRDLKTTLTPYNWTYVQKVRVEHGGNVHDLNIQRRCLHCDTPTCAALCPFGVIEKDRKGAISIHEDGCFGGAKCRTVCPWNIPQRQAGVGIYLKMLPKFAGGGVMYKCDLCAPRLAKGDVPACVEACRSRLGDQAPLTFGSRKDMASLARLRAREVGGYVYGDDENGGTGTFYVSPVPFERIEAELRKREKERFFFPEDPNPLEKPNLVAEAALVAPLAAVAGAIFAGARTLAIGKEPPPSQDRVCDAGTGEEIPDREEIPGSGDQEVKR